MYMYHLNLLVRQGQMTQIPLDNVVLAPTTTLSTVPNVPRIYKRFNQRNLNHVNIPEIFLRD